MLERFQVRPFEKIASDLRWTGPIEDGVYVWSVGVRTYRLRTVEVGADERGEFAWLEPYEEPLDSGLWLRVEAEREELFGEEHVYCRVSVLRVSEVFVDPHSALRRQGIDPASVNVLMEGFSSGH
jgi:hypothetical protein